MATFLILAHSDLEHLKELLMALKGNRIIIHLDKKCIVSRSQLTELIKNANAQLIDEEKSINVQWAGFSQVRAMLLLMQTALPLMDSQEKLIFISGCDYPIRPLDEILSCLDNSVAMQFLRYYPLDERKKDLRRWSLYHRWDFRLFKKRGSYLNRLNSLLIRLLTILELLLRGRKINPGYPLMAGSQWFAISKECVEDMLKIRDKHFDRFFSTMFAPDEVYFHTLFAMSKFAKSNMDNGICKCNSDSSRVFQVRNLTYVDESMNKWLNLEDLEKISRSNFLFARKFSSDISSGLRAHLKKSLAL